MMGDAGLRHMTEGPMRCRQILKDGVLGAEGGNGPGMAWEKLGVKSEYKWGGSRLHIAQASL